VDLCPSRQEFLSILIINLVHFKSSNSYSVCKLNKEKLNPLLVVIVSVYITLLHNNNYKY